MAIVWFDRRLDSFVSSHLTSVDILWVISSRSSSQSSSEDILSSRTCSDRIKSRWTNDSEEMMAVMKTRRVCQNTHYLGRKTAKARVSHDAQQETASTCVWSSGSCISEFYSDLQTDSGPGSLVGGRTSRFHHLPGWLRKYVVHMFQGVFQLRQREERRKIIGSKIQCSRTLLEILL